MSDMRYNIGLAKVENGEPFLAVVGAHRNLEEDMRLMAEMMNARLTEPLELFWRLDGLTEQQARQVSSLIHTKKNITEFELRRALAAPNN